ncbi:hypothetical protein [Nonomuraea turcica]|uniref:hypothetical protein n=1 Tax=Nonomuraea sp. G32 TaxID=3067274 RepID=UPI00273C74EC|nr:hypothetical protein [Nonomuraea sp. G32]MDP4501070.1 hypothetical protein [Nonomuraea sp. G32]
MHDVAAAVLACVCEALDRTAAEVEGQPGCPCRACVVAGAPAFDQCEDPCSGEPGGQLTVNVERVWPSSSFPEEDRDVRGVKGCAPVPTLAAELVITLLRCAPMQDEGGCPPSCEELEAAARIVHVDAVTILSALQCCLPTTAGRRGRRYVMGRTRILTPEGGCMGVEARVTVALPGICCPDGEVSP